jgi:hypothetical protein
MRVAYLNVLRILLDRDIKIMKNTASIAGFPAKIRTQYLEN